jgi:phospholipid/cholesterol/gamma-HCH transport system substrate-binding protein
MSDKTDKMDRSDKMDRTLTPPRRFRGIRRQVSVFLLTAVFGFIGAVGLVAWKQGMFVQQTSIYFHARDASGISKGMPVRLHGVPVGAVKELSLAEFGGVRVRLGINSDYIPMLPRNSLARMAREGYVGASSIQILTGSASGDRSPIRDGEEIRFVAQKGLNDMLDEVRAQMTPAFQELRRVAAELGDPDGDFRRSVASMRELLEELPPATRELRAVLRSTDRTMTSLGRQAEATLGTFARLGEQTERDLPVLAGKLATTLDSLNATATQVRETTRSNGEALRELLGQAPEVVRNSNALVRDSQELAAAARRTWLLRDYVDAVEMRTLPVDSFESFGKR